MWIKSWFACIESPIGKLNERVPTFSILSQRSRVKALVAANKWLITTPDGVCSRETEVQQKINGVRTSAKPRDCQIDTLLTGLGNIYDPKNRKIVITGTLSAASAPKVLILARENELGY